MVLHPAQIPNRVLRTAKSLQLIQLLTAGNDKIRANLSEQRRRHYRFTGKIDR